MEETKIQLSADELILMQNSDWILTKNRIIDKIDQGFGSLVTSMQQQLAGRLLIDETILLYNPKISRGEKYQGLPYLILDYPRVFGKENILAIRTLFWWGNYFSITLHVKGENLKAVKARLVADLHEFKKQDLFISVSGDEWSHDLGTMNYTELSTISSGELIHLLAETDFLKLAARVQFGPWNVIEGELFGLFLQLSQLLKS